MSDEQMRQRTMLFRVLNDRHPVEAMQALIKQVQRSPTNVVDIEQANLIYTLYKENRSIDESLNIAWATLSKLPKSELTRLANDQIDKYYGAKMDELLRVSMERR